MSEELDHFQIERQETLPNATAVLVLGILSLITCFIYGIIGLILGIVAIALHKKDKIAYQNNPVKYEDSFKNSKAGNICAIIGVILSGIYLLFIISGLAFIILAGTIH